MRAALYARYSTDLQNVASIADQFATCRSFAAKEATPIVATFEDAAISGGSAANRPGLHGLMRGAKNGEFDVVLCEALDRLSRSQADVAALFEDLRFHGVKIRTISEGDISELQIGLMGTMNALQLRETGRKTRRGLQGVVRSGRHTGGHVYGYKIRRELDAIGEPIRGLRDIVPDEAKVVREIFRRYAAGQSPRTIVSDLNMRGIPSPRGGSWNASTINGNAERLVDQIAEGVLTGAAVKDRLDALEARRSQIEAELAQAPVAPVVALHPRVAEHYRSVVDSLERALDRSDSEAAAEARDLVRKLIETVVVTPMEERGKFALTVQGKIAALVNQDGENTIKVGAGVGFEPTTFRL